MKPVATLSRAILAGNADVLRAIRDDDVSIAIWEREPPYDMVPIPLNDFRDIRFETAIGDLADQIEVELEDAGFAEGILRTVLATDITALGKHFAEIMDLAEVEIRLEHVTTNACKKFHGDYVTARLICTYVGPGTQWLDGMEAEDCGCGTVHNIRRMQAGDAAILKGRRWSEHNPAIHRSPPIEGTREERLVLVINPPMAA